MQKVSLLLRQIFENLFGGIEIRGYAFDRYWSERSCIQVLDGRSEDVSMRTLGATQERLFDGDLQGRYPTRPFHHGLIDPGLKSQGPEDSGINVDHSVGHGGVLPGVQGSARARGTSRT